MIPGFFAGAMMGGALAPWPPAAASNVPLDTDANYQSHTILLDFEGANGSTAFKDYGVNVAVWNNWVAVGNAQLTTTSPISGTSSLLLDGTDDYVYAIVPNAMGTGDFTFECDIKPASLATDGEIFCISSASFSTSNFNLVFEVKTTGALRASIQNGSGGTNADVTTAAGLITAGTKYNVCCEADGSTLRVYIDGVQRASAAITGTRVQDETHCRFGFLSNEYSGTVTRYFNGQIDNARLTKGISLYPSGTTYTPPTSHTIWKRHSYTTGYTAAETNNAQGVASDGTHVWHSSSGTIYKYTAAGSLVTSRYVMGDTPSGKSQINGMYIKDGRLFVSAAENSTPRKAWIVEYDPDALTYVQHWSVSGDWFSEGLAWWEGYWWVIFHANMEVARCNSSFSVLDTYSLTYSVTGSSGGYGAGTGYDGIFIQDGLLYANIHETYNEHKVDVYRWDGADWVEHLRIPRPSATTTQGMAIDGADPSQLWFAERLGAGTDKFAKVSVG